MANNWYETNDWYAPYNSVEEPMSTVMAGGDNPKQQKRQRKKKGLTPVRIAGLIFLLLLVIAGTSIAFRHSGSGSGSDFFQDNEEVMPDDPESFFKQYYEAVENDSAEVNLPEIEHRPEFSVALQPATGEELSLQDLYERCAPTIVSISAYKDGIIGYSWGSGVIISQDGLILTNCHVIEECDKVIVTLPDGMEYDALLVGADSISDVAVLKINAQGLPVAVLGESSLLRVGDRVAAIGNPLGETFRNTLTDGIISAIERGMTYRGRSMTLLQTNTAINEGNSGGALFNLQGQVIGITNMKMMSGYSSIEGIGFAIPSSTVCSVVNALIQDGEVKGRPSIGITVGAIPGTAKEKYSLPDGLYVTDVSEGSDAKEKGIKVGDVVIAANGSPVISTQDITDIKNELQVGDVIVLTVWRNGETLEIPVTLVDTNEIYG